MSRNKAALLYGTTLLVLAAEAVVAWQALHPTVSENYRAYYIDQTTTCLDQPVTGAYRFGKAVSFRDNWDEVIPLRVCGWEGPVGDGLHAVGESSRLRFRIPPAERQLQLTLELVAVDFAPAGRQPVIVSVRGVIAGKLDVRAGTPQRFHLPVVIAENDGTLEVELAYPEAITVAPQDSNTRKRSIKLTLARIARSSQQMASPASVSASGT